MLYVIFKFSTLLVFHRLPRFNKPGLLPFRQLLKQMTQQQFREEELNYFKFSTIVLERFPKALHQTFKTMWDNNLTHLHSHHRLHCSEKFLSHFRGWKNQSSHTPLLRKMGLCHPVPGPSGNTAETLALAIDQLRLLRNSLIHSLSPEIVKVTFDQ